MRWAIVVLVGALLAPSSAHGAPGLDLVAQASAPPAVATLHAHVGGVGVAPLATSAPPAAFQADVAAPAYLQTFRCPGDPVTDPILGQALHATRGYVALHGVHYAKSGDVVSDPAQDPSYSPVAGLSADLELLVGPVLHWYLSAPAPTAALPVPAPAAPVVAPEVVVRATLRAGTAEAYDAAAFPALPLVAEGQSEAALLAGARTEGATWSTVGDRDVYHFTFPLALAPGGSTVDDEAGLAMLVEVFQRVPGCPEGSVMTNTLAVHTSDGHRPRFELEVANPLRLEAEVRPDDGQGRASLQGRAFSPWNAADVADLSVRIDGPLGKTVPTRDLAYTVDDFTAPIPRTASFAWDTSDVPAGHYVAVFMTRNLQGTEVEARIPFTVAGPQPVPGLAVLPLLAAVVASAALAARRR